jgi:RNA recognition motif-containing protein
MLLAVFCRELLEEICLKLYVGNLPFTATESEIRGLCTPHGEVDSVNLITDRETGNPRGFGFVEMTSGGDKAIQALNGVDLGGRNLKVNEAKPRTEGTGSRSW